MRLEASGQLTRLEAAAAQEALLRVDIELLPFEPIAARVWELREKLTCHDAWCVTVAETLNLPLATLDERFGRAPRPACRFLVAG